MACGAEQGAPATARGPPDRHRQRRPGQRTRQRELLGVCSYDAAGDPRARSHRRARERPARSASATGLRRRRAARPCEPRQPYSAAERRQTPQARGLHNSAAHRKSVAGEAVAGRRAASAQGCCSKRTPPSAMQRAGEAAFAALFRGVGACALGATARGRLGGAGPPRCVGACMRIAARASVRPTRHQQGRREQRRRRTAHRDTPSTRNSRGRGWIEFWASF